MAYCSISDQLNDSTYCSLQTMVIPEEREGKTEASLQLLRDSSKATDAVSSRKAGGRKKEEKATGKVILTAFWYLTAPRKQYSYSEQNYESEIKCSERNTSVPGNRNCSTIIHVLSKKKYTHLLPRINLMKSSYKPC